ncbi:MAG TPA: DUF4926 domain-containing protein [Bryobacterales bacterium]|nr:DUF4926 domain-containing protein [Bryobacterales bacterium]
MELLSVVALLEDAPGDGLRCGQVGTVVEKLDEGVYEVEFSDDQGQTYASAALKESQLIRLRYEPPSEAA